MSSSGMNGGIARKCKSEGWQIATYALLVGVEDPPGEPLSPSSSTAPSDCSFRMVPRSHVSQARLYCWNRCCGLYYCFRLSCCYYRFLFGLWSLLFGLPWTKDEVLSNIDREPLKLLLGVQYWEMVAFWGSQIPNLVYLDSLLHISIAHLNIPAPFIDRISSSTFQIFLSDVDSISNLWWRRIETMNI